MDATFGARLRAQREYRQVSLADIADRTKIKLSLLEGLERDDVSQWPAGIFRRSYVRAYAQAIGLDPDRVLREFLVLYPEPVEVTPESIGEARTRGRDVGARPPTRLRFLIDSAMSAFPARRPSPAVSHDVPSGDPPVGAVPAAPGMSLPAIDGIRAAAPEHPAWSEKAVIPESTITPPLPGAEVPDLPAQAPSGAAEADPASDDAVVGWTAQTALADLCAQLSRASERHDIAMALRELQSLVEARGVVLWVWDPERMALRAAICAGYPEEILGQWPAVGLGDGNAIAAAFRSGDLQVVEGRGGVAGAVVAPLATPTGCTGVLALELADGGEQKEAVGACARIVAALLSALIDHQQPLARSATA